MWWERLKKAMEARGITPDELATAVNVDRGRIYDYLRGRTKNPRGDVLEQIARAVEVDALYLRHGISSEQTVTLRNIPLLTLRDIASINPVMSLLDIDDKGLKIALPVENPERCVAVQNDNAANIPDLQPNDILVFDIDAELEPGRYVIAVTPDDGSAHIGVYRPLVHNSTTTFELRFANPDFPSITVDNNRPGRILARAVGKYSAI